jgi:hypothetical protein
MFYRLLTVTEAHEQDDSILIEPTVLLGDGRIPRGAMVPMAGTPLELRLPGGETRTAEIKAFGVRVTAAVRDGVFRLSERPKPPFRATLTVRHATLDDLPAGTEIWISS